MQVNSKQRKPGVTSVPGPSVSPPGWRATTAPHALAEDIINTLDGAIPETRGHHFTTHFMAGKEPLAGLLKHLGIQRAQQSSTSVSYAKVQTFQAARISFLGHRIHLGDSANTIFLYHVTEARTDGHNVRLITQNREIIFSGLCRPLSFTQAVNRMLASPVESAVARCADCRHYVLWQTAGNLRECRAQEPEAADCPVQGNDHWCPAHRARTSKESSP